MSFRELRVVSTAAITLIAMAACAPAAAPDRDEAPGGVVETPSGGSGSGSVAAGEDSVSFPGGLPVAQFEADEVARVDLAAGLDADPNRLELLVAEKKEWPSPALGCPEPGMAYDSVIVPGYRLVYGYGKQRYAYHTNEDGSDLVHCADADTTPSPTDSGGEGNNGPPPADRIVVLAPIGGVEISIAESYPPQYFVRVLSALPNGCARFDDYGVVREGDLIKIKVTNSVPAPGGLMACTMIYGTAEHIIALGTEFTPGETYTVEVNDVTETFVAQ